MKTDNLKQFRDTRYYLNTNGEVFLKLKRGGYRQTKGFVDSEKRTRINVGSKKYSLSRMVYETFKGEIPKGYVVVHRNGCSTMNDLGNLMLVEQKDSAKYCKLRKTTKKVINLDTHKIYKGLHSANKDLKSCRQTIALVCSGANLPQVKYHVAWWDDVNGKAFRGDYYKYYNKYMKEELEC